VADFRLYVEGLETVLADRRLVVADPRVPGAVGLTLLPPGALARSGAIAAEAVQAPAASPEGKLGTEVTR
jgi:hypothetical protein